MRKRLAIFAVLVMSGTGTLAATTSSEATPAGVDVAVTGRVVAGVTGAQPYQELAFSFTLKNKSATASIDTAFTFTVENGTIPDGGFICPLVTTGFDINPDSPSCETGMLGPRKTTQAAILVQTPSTPGVTMTVRACGTDLNGSTDPNHDNDCATLSVPIS